MPNFLALASVTATISYMLEEVNKDVPGVKITTRPLDAIEVQNPVNALNVFLYLVKPSSSLGVIDVVGKDSSGNPTANPLLLLDLHYVITATAAENDDLVAQQILASAMRILNEHPIIPGETIRKAIRSKEGLEGSDLADQMEDVKLNLDSLTADDLTRIWSRFPSANFRPSIAYTANVVLLESKLVTSPGPMRAIAVGDIAQLTSPIIERIEPRILEYAPGAEIMIVGENLKADNVAIEFNDSLVTVPKKIDDVSERRIIVQIPENLEPGISQVRVLHRLNSMQVQKGNIYHNDKKKGITRTDNNPRSSLRSNASPFVLAPRIVSPREAKIKRGTDFIIDFEPAVANERIVYLVMGNEPFEMTPIMNSSNSDKRTTQAKVRIPDDIKVGTYLLRVSIGGAESRLDVDGNPRSPTFKKATGPYVQLV